MLSAGFILLRLLTGPAPDAPTAPVQSPAVKAMVREIADSGRCATVAESPDERVISPKMVPAGAPPLLSFRYYESKAHHGAGDSGLMLDDAGH
jgi:hypothetical protein